MRETSSISNIDILFRCFLNTDEKKLSNYQMLFFRIPVTLKPTSRPANYAAERPSSYANSGSSYNSGKNQL